MRSSCLITSLLSSSTQSARLHFDNDTLAALHNITLASKRDANETANVDAFDNSRYIYAVTNLRYDETNTDGTVDIMPCMGENPVSRWRPRADLNASECINTLQADTVAAFKSALETSNDENPYLRDIYLWNDHTDDKCNEADLLAYGMLIQTDDDEGCWENIHPDFLSIFEFNKYVEVHALLRNTTLGDDTSITGYANIGIMQYPDNHPMSYFEAIKKDSSRISYVERMAYATTLRVNQGARYGDNMVVDPFADQLYLNYDRIVLKELAHQLGKMTLRNDVVKNRGGGTIVCGSPNEVKPDPMMDDYFDVIHRDLDCIGCQVCLIMS